MKKTLKVIHQPILWTTILAMIVLSPASAQVNVRGTPMERVNLSQASIEEIHQVAEKDARLVWSLMHLPDPIEHKVSPVTHKDVQERAAIFRVYARLHRLEGDNADAYTDWALNTLDRLRQSGHH
jgi:hypothetical protein